MDSGQYGEGGDESHLTNNNENNLLDVADSNVLGSNIDFQNKPNLTQTIGDNVNKPTANQQNNAGKKLINYDLKYKNTDKGPFCIYVEHTDLNVGQLHPMRVGSILSELPKPLQSDIIEVMSVGRSRIKVFFKSAAAANFLVGHQIFVKHSLRSYVPQHLIEKKALVRNVDTSLTEAELKQKIISDISVTNVKRLMRMTLDENGMRITVPRQMVIVTFDGLIIPDHIYIDYVRCPVETYVSPVMQCFNCLRYGHSSKLCRGKKRCRVCGGEHDGDCVNTAYCVYCKNHNHNSTSKICPKYTEQKNIKNIMASKNLSFKGLSNWPPIHLCFRPY